MHSGGSSLFKDNLENSNYKKIKVKGTTLDKYCSLKEVSPSFIKLDIEGGEYLALQGAIKTLKKYSPQIAMELKNDQKHKKAASFLFELDYKVFEIKDSGNLNQINELDFSSLGGTNFVFKRGYN